MLLIFGSGTIVNYTLALDPLLMLPHGRRGFVIIGSVTSGSFVDNTVTSESFIYNTEGY